MTGIGLIIANIFGYIVANWRLILSLLAVAIVLGFIGFGLSKCGGGAKLDEKQIQQAQRAIEINDRKEMTEILAQSDLAEKQINANLANAENEKLKALSESRKKYDGLSNDDLARELEKRK